MDNKNTLHELDEVVEASRSASQTSEVIYNFEPARVLIVDDLETNRELLATYLEDCPFELFFANNGEEAVNISQEQEPDLILMDMKMPVMSGYRATKIIKETIKKAIPVIAVTASALKESEEEIRTLCDGYLRKPVSVDELLKEISNFLTHTIKTETITTDINPVDNIKLILNLLTEELNEEIKEAANCQEISSLKLLLQKMATFEEQCNCTIFKEWLWKLNELFNQFDTEGLCRKLLDKQEVIEELQAVLNKSN